jgi:hypothetical protein
MFTLEDRTPLSHNCTFFISANRIGKDRGHEKSITPYSFDLEFHLKYRRDQQQSHPADIHHVARFCCAGREVDWSQDVVL